jgi:hypothetical protein
MMVPPSGNKIRVIIRVRPFLEEELKLEELAIHQCMKVKDITNEIE